MGIIFKTCFKPKMNNNQGDNVPVAIKVTQVGANGQNLSPNLGLQKKVIAEGM